MTRTQRLFQTSLVLLFLASLGIPAIDMVFKLDNSPLPNEKRLRAKLPMLPSDLKSLKSVFKDFESYFNDNFGFRNALIALNGSYKFDLFNVSPSPDGLVGKDNWLFYANQQNVELYRNLLPFSEAELAEIIQLIAQRDAWTKKNNIPYVYMVGPDSHTLNPEHLPDWATKVGPESRLDQVIRHGKGLPILDLRPPLFEAKKAYSVSHSTDTHWNPYGAYIAYIKILDFFRSRGAKIGPSLPISDFKIESTVGYGLHVASLMALHGRLMDKHTSMTYTGKRKFEVVERDGLHFTTRNPEGEDLTVVCVCDSMAGNLFPLLGNHFKTVRVMWGYPFEIEEIKRYKPDLIIQLVIERTLNWGQHRNPKEVERVYLEESSRRDSL